MSEAEEKKDAAVASSDGAEHHHHHHHHHSDSPDAAHSGQGDPHRHHGGHHHHYPRSAANGAKRKRKTNPRVFFSVLGLLIVIGAAIGLVAYNRHTENVLHANAFEEGFDSAKDPEALKVLKKRRGENLGARFVQVTKVIDGETIEVSRDGETRVVRIRGIECLDIANRRHGESQGAELNLDWDKVQWYGDAAASYVLNFVTANNEVAIRIPVDGPEPLDDYGNLLTYVEIGNRDLGAELVRRGLAMASSENHPRLAEYNKLEEEARDNNIGMFGAL